LGNSYASVFFKLGTPAPSLALEAAKVAALLITQRLTHYLNLTNISNQRLKAIVGSGIT